MALGSTDRTQYDCGRKEGWKEERKEKREGRKKDDGKESKERLKLGSTAQESRAIGSS